MKEGCCGKKGEKGPGRSKCALSGAQSEERLNGGGAGGWD